MLHPVHLLKETATEASRPLKLATEEALWPLTNNERSIVNIQTNDSRMTQTDNERSKTNNEEALWPLKLTTKEALWPLKLTMIEST